MAAIWLFYQRGNLMDCFHDSSPQCCKVSWKSLENFGQSCSQTVIYHPWHPVQTEGGYITFLAGVMINCVILRSCTPPFEDYSVSAYKVGFVCHSGLVEQLWWAALPYTADDSYDLSRLCIRVDHFDHRVMTASLPQCWMRSYQPPSCVADYVLSCVC